MTWPFKPRADYTVQKSSYSCHFFYFLQLLGPKSYKMITNTLPLYTKDRDYSSFASYPFPDELSPFPHSINDSPHVAHEAHLLVMRAQHSPIIHWPLRKEIFPIFSETCFSTIATKLFLNFPLFCERSPKVYSGPIIRTRTLGN